MKKLKEIQFQFLNNSECVSLMQTAANIADCITNVSLLGYVAAFKAMVKSFGKILASNRGKPEHLMQIVVRLRLKAYLKLCKTLSGLEKSGKLESETSGILSRSLITRCVDVDNMSTKQVTKVVEALVSKVRSIPTAVLEKLGAKEPFSLLKEIEFTYLMSEILSESMSESDRKDNILIYRNECLCMYTMLADHAEYYAEVDHDKGCAQFVKAMNHEISLHKGLAAKCKKVKPVTELAEKV